MSTTPPRPDETAPIDNPLDMLLGYHLRRASAAILADLAQALEDLALSPTEASVLLNANRRRRKLRLRLPFDIKNRRRDPW